MRQIDRYAAGMALLHKAELHPTKLELLAAWLPGRPWYHGPASGQVARVAACRFDDPAGAVGIETILIRAGNGQIHHTPLTYRDAALPGRADWLLGTTEHSVLGRRWVYDACGDPVYVQALTRAIFTGDGQSEEFVDDAGELRRREPDMAVSGRGASGADVPAIRALERVVDEDPTLIVAGSVELSVIRVVSMGRQVQGPALSGKWGGQATPMPLAYARLRKTSSEPS